MQTTVDVKCLVCGALVEGGTSRFCPQCRGGGQGAGTTPPAFPPYGMPAGSGPRRPGSGRRRALAVLIGVVAVVGAGSVLVQAFDPDRYLQGSTWEQDEIDHFRADVQEGAREAGAEIPADILDCVVAEVMKQHTPDQMRGMDTGKAEEIGATLTLGCLDSLGYPTGAGA